MSPDRPERSAYGVANDPALPDAALSEIGPGIGGKYTMYAWGNHLDSILRKA